MMVRVSSKTKLRHWNMTLRPAKIINTTSSDTPQRRARAHDRVDVSEVDCACATCRHDHINQNEQNKDEMNVDGGLFGDLPFIMFDTEIETRVQHSIRKISIHALEIVLFLHF